MWNSHTAYVREHELYDSQFLKFLFQILKLSWSEPEMCSNPVCLLNWFD